VLCNAGNNSSLHTPVQNLFLNADALRAGGQNAAAARIGGKKRRSDNLDAAAFPQLPFGCPLQLVAACRGALTGLGVFSKSLGNPPLSSASQVTL
jgi:hypothetical protein